MSLLSESVFIASELNGESQMRVLCMLAFSFGLFDSHIFIQITSY